MPTPTRFSERYVSIVSDRPTKLISKIDKYAQDARTEISGRSTEHTEQVRDLQAGKQEMERRINNEREKEAQMLAGRP
jgi:hypothetical protein